MLTAVGNPENRRVAGFLAAAEASGVDVEVLSWRDLLRGMTPAPGLVRVDSPGENQEVRRALLERGARRIAEPLDAPTVEALSADGTRIGGGRQAYLGMLDVLSSLSRCSLLPSVEAIGLCGDKSRCSAHLRDAEVPVPRVLPPVASFDDVLAAMRSTRSPRIFLKPRHGSSASGVLAWETDGVRHQVTTSVELSEGVLHNSLRVRRYRDLGVIRQIVEALAPEGLHAERWLPKAGIGGRAFDLRVVVVGGRAEHVVVRTARGPLTNLHLGNRRGDLSSVRSRLGDSWHEAMDICVRAAQAIPGLPWCGVDLLVTAAGRFAVCEVNAFGDLLPGVSNGRGRNTWEAEVDWLVADGPLRHVSTSGA